MPNQQQFVTKIIVEGALDPSLAKTMGYSNQQLSKMNQMLNSIGSTNKVVVKSFATFSPELQKANVESSKLASSLKNVGVVLAALGVADILVSGLKSAVGLAEQLGDKFARFASEASKLSSERELLTKGLGNLLGNQAQADLVHKQMFNIAKASPFQAKDLVHPIQRFVASGMSLPQAEWLAKRQGDLMAGIGGGAEEMDRATLAFQEINAKGYANSKQLNTQLGALGIPVQKTLEQILHVTPEQLDKMIRKHQITSDIVQKMVEVLTGPNGMFFESMKKFAETFQGLSTAIKDEFQYFEADFGDILNDITKIVYEFAGGTDIWNKVNDYMANLKRVNHAVLSIVTSMPRSDTIRALEPYFNIITGVFHSFNTWLGSFFDYADIPTQGQTIVLNASGVAAIESTFTFSKLLFKQIWEFANADEVIKLISLSAQLAQLTAQAGNLDKLKGMFTIVSDILVIVGDFLTSNFAKGAIDTGKLTRDVGSATTAFFNSQHAPRSQDYWPRNVPYFASGGIVNSPTLGVIGESGPEAILPLSGASTLDDLATAISNLNSFLTNVFPAGTPGGGVGAGYGGVMGGIRGGGSGSLNTVFGPGVAGDQPGQANYDYDSYHGIGHIHGVRYNLGPGSVAIHADYAEGVLHLKPGQWFKNPRNGKWQRWSDTSGSGNDQNIDEYVPGNASASVHVTYNISTIEAKDVHRVVKEHAAAIRKHLENDSNHQAKINSKALV
ncbi:MAG: tape measure protein [Verrucomicrobia bacterium]|nr:tape measure protein [Verrucomicrobiota bacterium]